MSHISQPVERLTRENISSLSSRLMELESFWEQTGETPWTEDGLRMELPSKFNGLSMYVPGPDGKVLGYLIGSTQLSPTTGKIHKIITHPEYRQRKLGTALWDSFLSACREKGLKKLEFRALDDNVPALNFYRKKGCVFHGYTLGTDSKNRRDITYTFSADRFVPHSRATMGEDELEAVAEPILTGMLGQGARSAEFVQSLAGTIGKEYGIACSNGTAAIFLALRAMLPPDKREVILPSYVCRSVLNAVDNARAIPKIADIHLEDYSMSFADARKKITPQTGAIILPHMFGIPAKDLGEFLECGIPVIEDCAQSIGGSTWARKLGSLGHASTYSFYVTKMISTGAGGAVLTNDRALYAKLQDLTKYDGRDDWSESHNLSFSDMAAAIGISQLEKLPDFVSKRRYLATQYSSRLGDLAEQISLPTLHPDGVFFRYVIRTPDALDMIASLKKRGVSAERPVYKPLHRYLALDNKNFPNTEAAYNETVSLPIYPSLSHEAMDDVIGAVANWRYEK